MSWDGVQGRGVRVLVADLQPPPGLMQVSGAEVHHSHHPPHSSLHPQVHRFLRLLSTPEVASLLERDRCYLSTDRFLLATAFVYFKRAGLALEEFTVGNFWLALYLAHDQEEDEERSKWELLPWALGPDWQVGVRDWMAAKMELWKRMDYRSLVSRRQCEQVMALATHPAWGRYRSTSHGGARRGQEEQFVPTGPLQDTPPCLTCEEVELVRVVVPPAAEEVGPMVVHPVVEVVEEFNTSRVQQLEVTDQEAMEGVEDTIDGDRRKNLLDQLYSSEDGEEVEVKGEVVFEE